GDGGAVEEGGAAARFHLEAVGHTAFVDAKRKADGALDAAAARERGIAAARVAAQVGVQRGVGIPGAGAASRAGPRPAARAVAPARAGARAGFGAVALACAGIPARTVGRLAVARVRRRSGADDRGGDLLRRTSNDRFGGGVRGCRSRLLPILRRGSRRQYGHIRRLLC